MVSETPCASACTGRDSQDEWSRSEHRARQIHATTPSSHQATLGDLLGNGTDDVVSATQGLSMHANPPSKGREGTRHGHAGSMQSNPAFPRKDVTVD
jgi:hypothetical protein